MSTRVAYHAKQLNRDPPRISRRRCILALARNRTIGSDLALPPGVGMVLDVRTPSDAIYVGFGPMDNTNSTVIVAGVIKEGGVSDPVGDTVKHVRTGQIGQLVALLKRALNGPSRESFSPAGIATKGLFGYDRTTGRGSKASATPTARYAAAARMRAGGASPNGPNQGGAAGFGKFQSHNSDGLTGVYSSQPTNCLNIQTAGAHAVCIREQLQTCSAWSTDSGQTWAARDGAGCDCSVTSIVAGKTNGTFVGNGDFTTIITSTDAGRRGGLRRRPARRQLR